MKNNKKQFAYGLLFLCIGAATLGGMGLIPGPNFIHAQLVKREISKDITIASERSKVLDILDSKSIEHSGRYLNGSNAVPDKEVAHAMIPNVLSGFFCSGAVQVNFYFDGAEQLERTEFVYVATGL